MRAGKSYLERPMQHLHPLELSCDKLTELEREKSTLNPEASVWRPKRNVTVAAELRAKDIVEAEEDCTDNQHNIMFADYVIKQERVLGVVQRN